MTSISVIIPAHNEENYIKKTLHALKEQTFQNFETIVVANGCTDKTEEIVAKKEVVDKRNIMLLKLSEANVSKARNHGANNASGDLLVFLDADTILDNNTLQIINTNFSNNHAVGTTKVRPEPSSKKFNLLMNLKNLANKTGIYNGWVSGALICRKEDFNKVQGYDGNRTLREHRNLILKLLKQGEFTLVNTYTTTSMRRFQNWGLIKAATFWIKQTIKDNFGDITKSDYEKVR